MNRQGERLMDEKKALTSDWPHVRDELRYHAVLAGLALMIPLSLTAILWMLPAAQAIDSWYADETGGVIYVHGALTESACRLEMDSVRQDLWLGEVPTGKLTQPGDRGGPVALDLRLRDCLRNPSESRDERYGALSWGGNQPAVRVSFRAPADADSPQLVKVQGVSGLGLRLQDAQGNDVRLGARGKPLLLASGQNALSYTVTPERTPASLVAGSYQAVVDFFLSYD